MITRAVEPVTIVTTDGEERKLLLTFGAQKRFRDRVKGLTPEETNEQSIDIAATLFWECLMDKTGLTEESFLDILPANEQWLMEVFSAVKGLPQTAIPTEPTETPKPTGSPSGAMAAKSSASRKRSSGE